MQLRILLPLTMMIFISFFPTFIGGMSLYAGQRILYLGYPVILILAYILTSRFSNKLFPSEVAYVLLVVSLVLLLTVLSKLSFLGYQLAFAHFRYLAYSIVFFMAYSLAIHLRLTILDIYYIFMILAIFLVAFVLMQFCLPSFISATGISNRPPGGRLGLRIGGPFVWSYGFAFSLFPIVFTLLSMVQKSKVGYLSVGLLLVCAILVVLGQSKAAYLAYSVLGLLFCILGFRYSSAKRSLVILVALFVMVAFAAYYVFSNITQFGNILRFLEAVQEGQVDASTQTRLHQLSNLHFTLDSNPVLGFPFEYVVIENAFGYYFYTFGIVGILSYLTVICVLVYKNYKCMKYVHWLGFGNKEKSVALGMLAFSLSVPFFSLASSPLDGHKVSYYFWSLMGFYFGSLKYDEIRRTRSIRE